MGNHYKSTFFLFWNALKKYPKSTVTMFLSFATAFIFADFGFAFFMKKVIDALSLQTVSFSGWQEASLYLLMGFASMLIGIIFFRIGDWAIVYGQARIMADLTNHCFAVLTKHSYTFFSNSFTGSLVAKTRRFVRSFEAMHDKMIYALWFSVVKAIGALVVLSWLHPVLGLMMLGWIVTYVLMIVVLLPYQLRRDLDNATSDTKVTGQLADAITGVLNIKMFGTRDAERNNFDTYVQRQRRARSRAWNFKTVVDGCKAISMMIIEFCIMYYALLLWLNGGLTVGSLVLIQSMLLMLVQELWSLARSVAEFTRALADADEMTSIIMQPIEVQDPDVPEALRIHTGSIAFSDVQFSYQGGAPILQNFSLEIPAGQRVGLVGHSGAGKSTLFKLVLRFADLQAGTISIDGQDITTITQNDLRRSISYVPQDPILFHRTLFENISYAKHDATSQHVMQASLQAHAHEFISGLEKGYETLVGERGIKLSGGERQRIALARVMLKDAPLLLLDEATSSLDSISEKYIQDNLETLMKGRTVLAIAHRISTISQMDRILVMHKGQIVEDGNHQDLLKKNGVYADLWNHQVNGFIQ
ncbi:MAG: ABC transporter ATP-binding protein [bacterium]|nr:ABC transporter ATP-binding protein [bacterium]